MTIKKLKVYQADLTADILIMGILKYDDRPSGDELDGVDMEKLRKELTNGKKLPEDFDLECAKLRRYSHWEGDMFIIDYHLLRKYMFQHFGDLTHKQHIAMFEYDVQMKQIHEDIERLEKEERCAEGEMEEEMKEKRMPIFYNNEDDVEVFLKEIKGMSPNDITDLVNRWVKEKRISDYGNSRKGDLWTMLNDAGLYTKSRQNWCRRVY